MKIKNVLLIVVAALLLWGAHRAGFQTIDRCGSGCGESPGYAFLGKELHRQEGEKRQDPNGLSVCPMVCTQPKVYDFAPVAFALLAVVLAALALRRQN